MMSAEITVCLNAADGSPGRQLQAQRWWDHKIGSCPVTRQRDAANHRDAQQRLDVRVMRMRLKWIPQEDQQADLPVGPRARPRFLPEVTEDFRLSARTSAPMFVRCENQLWGLCGFGGDGGWGVRSHRTRPTGQRGQFWGFGGSRAASPWWFSGCRWRCTAGMGRASGRHVLAAGPRRTEDRQAPPAVAMVLRYDRGTHEAVICSAWGQGTDWVRNIQARPALRVQIGRSRSSRSSGSCPRRRAWPWWPGSGAATRRGFASLTAILGWEDLRSDTAARAFVSTRPFVSFRPADPPVPGTPRTW